MEQPAHSLPSPTPPNFAGLLASLASPEPAVEASGNELADDVVTISYEQALRNHARYRPGRQPSLEPPGIATDRNRPAAASNGDTEEASAVLTGDPAASVSHDLRTASVTIRLSEAECSRLRRRATEAGLTVSAYLRSCALEADTLRAQVKAALAELKAAAETHGATAPVRRPFFAWLKRPSQRKG